MTERLIAERRGIHTAVVVTGGDPLDPSRLPELPPDAVVVAADSGVDRAHDLGLTVDLAVGDFDSVTAEGLDRVTRERGGLARHPQAKDATDMELALGAASALEPARMVVLGGSGGRLDHLLANALLLASPSLAGVDVVAHMGPATVTVVRHEARLVGRVGDLVTLLAVHGRATGIRTDGLLYPLDDEDLEPGSTRGVSNEMARQEVSVRLATGVLLAVQPGGTGTHLMRGLR